MKFSDFPSLVQDAVKHYHNIYPLSSSLQIKKEFINDKYPFIELADFVLAEFYFIKSNLKRSGRYKYFITFTLKDNCKSAEAESFLRETIIKRKDNLGITSFKYVKEHVNTNFHIHAVMATTEPLRKNRFNVYEKRYGFVQIKNIKQGTESEVDNYIAKENAVLCIV